MFFYEGLSCPHCHRRFHESDDVVACPVCGAPHHRGCWGDAGGCACREAHGTDQQWSRDAAKAAATQAAQPDAAQQPAYAAYTDTVKCPQCGSPNSPYAEICSHCGRPLNAQEWNSATQQRTPPPPMRDFNEYTPFHSAAAPSCGGVNPNAEIEGETAEDLAAVVRSNTNYYLPRFQRIAQSGSKTAWNIAAFLIPHVWLFFRKMPLWGAIASVFEVIFLTVFSVLRMTVFASVMSDDAMMSIDYDALYELLATNEKAMLASMMLMMLVAAYVLYHLLFGFFGTRLYMSTCLKNIRRTRDLYPEGYRTQLSMIGGTSFGLAIMGALCREFIPSLLIALLFYQI